MNPLWVCSSTSNNCSVLQHTDWEIGCRRSCAASERDLTLKHHVGHVCGIVSFVTPRACKRMQPVSPLTLCCLFVLCLPIVCYNVLNHTLPLLMNTVISSGDCCTSAYYIMQHNTTSSYKSLLCYKTALRVLSSGSPYPTGKQIQYDKHSK